MSAVATATTADAGDHHDRRRLRDHGRQQQRRNGFASTTDDCTLISVVAGAQVANNQAFTLKVAYVWD
jgi:hypothetical protein